MNFKQTGNKIPVSADILTNYVNQQLNNYKGSGPNPFTTPIIYKTPENKSIMVPTNLQNQIINTWKSQHPEKFDDLLTEQEQIPLNPVVKTDKYKTMKIIILVLIALFVLYLFFQHNNSNGEYLVGDRGRYSYFLTK
jgi:hypothetical protein